MIEPPSSDEIEEAAIELAIDPSFVEKDWYAVQALESVVKHSRSNIPATFSGGTSLSKGYGLIQRFSEDLDFVISCDQSPTRSDRRNYRESIIQEIELTDVFKINKDSIKVGDAGRFFSFDINYPQAQKNHTSLRPYLKLEMSFRDLSMASLAQPIRSLVSELKKEEATFQIPCVAPAETGADKFCALIWRVFIKDRAQAEGDKQNEPQIMRHLHDLCALESVIMDNRDFSKLVLEKFPGDAKRAGFDSDYSLDRAAKDMIDRIEADQLYRDEYDQFVKAMSYATESQQVDFDKAINVLKRIGDSLK